MTEKTYNQIEALLKAKRIQEEPEDILLEPVSYTHLDVYKRQGYRHHRGAGQSAL